MKARVVIAGAVFGIAVAMADRSASAYTTYAPWYSALTNSGWCIYNWPGSCGATAWGSCAYDIYEAVQYYPYTGWQFMRNWQNCCLISNYVGRNEDAFGNCSNNTEWDQDSNSEFHDEKTGQCLKNDFNYWGDGILTE